MIFYKIMGYKIPKDNRFRINKQLLENIKYIDYKPKYDNNYIEELKKILDKYGFLYKNIPFVKAIYVANSLSFLSVNKNSDIDLFIITYKNHIWQAKFWTSCIFWLFRIKRTKKNKKGKFCLGFFVEEDFLDFYSISIKPIDIYLAYWIMHLQPLYVEKKEDINHIYEANMWIKSIIPGFDGKFCYLLENKLFTGNGLFKKIINKILGWTIIDKVLNFLWLPVMKYKIKKMGKVGKDIIISNKMFKFFAPDKRKDVYIKYKLLKYDKKTNRANIRSNTSLFS